jgi:hypothetical protein
MMMPINPKMAKLNGGQPIALSNNSNGGRGIVGTN